MNPLAPPISACKNLPLLISKFICKGKRPRLKLTTLQRDNTGVCNRVGRIGGGADTSWFLWTFPKRITFLHFFPLQYVCYLLFFFFLLTMWLWSRVLTTTRSTKIFSVCSAAEILPSRPPVLYRRPHPARQLLHGRHWNERRCFWRHDLLHPSPEQPYPIQGRNNRLQWFWQQTISITQHRN